MFCDITGLADHEIYRKCQGQDIRYKVTFTLKRPGSPIEKIFAMGPCWDLTKSSGDASCLSVVDRSDPNKFPAFVVPVMSVVCVTSEDFKLPAKKAEPKPDSTSLFGEPAEEISKPAKNTVQYVLTHKLDKTSLRRLRKEFSTNSVSNWLTGKCRPSKKSLRKLKRIFPNTFKGVSR